MRVALVNPRWDYRGSVYFGCREPHLPLEYGYAKALLESAGHHALIVDCHLEGLGPAGLIERIELFRPDFTVVVTAPTYLFWRCPPPELGAPLAVLRTLAGRGGVLVLAGPHGSTTPFPVLEKTGADFLVRGEFEDILPKLASMPLSEWEDLPCVYARGRAKQGTANETDIALLPPAAWPEGLVERHIHHHHRFHDEPTGPAAEIEGSRGCPYSCSFCARENFRGTYRKRPLGTLLKEIDGLLARGARYLYFIDEIFFPRRDLLAALAERGVSFGIQTRIDLWTPDDLKALGGAGCVSVEAGVESVTEEGRKSLNRRSALTGRPLEEALVEAKRHIPFVQATLLGCPLDSAEDVEQWRSRLRAAGVWANVPVPLFPYPGSEEYRRRWGEPDGNAWERAHSHYLECNSQFSDIQESRPLPIRELETRGADAR